MSRWSPDARERLERAALELFEERGFAATTVPQIAERAGLTTRTFFRHFADKREVLYADDAAPGIVRRMMAEAPAGAEPMALVVEGARLLAEDLEGQREKVLRRRAIVRSDPGLLERSLHKRADVAVAIRTGFLERGVPPVTAALLAEICGGLVEVAFGEWLDQQGDRSLGDILLDCLGGLRAALAVSAPGTA